MSIVLSQRLAALERQVAELSRHVSEIQAPKRPETGLVPEVVKRKPGRPRKNG